MQALALQGSDANSQNVSTGESQYSSQATPQGTITGDEDIERPGRKRGRNRNTNGGAASNARRARARLEARVAVAAEAGLTQTATGDEHEV